jgi:hypothetical protein
MQLGEAEFRIPTHVGLGRKKGKRFVGSDEKAVADFWVPFSRVVERLIVEVLIGFWANGVTCFAQRVPVRFSRSSKRRCFSSQ